MKIHFREDPFFGILGENNFGKGQILCLPFRIIPEKSPREAENELYV